jgi:hypothetical protein
MPVKSATQPVPESAKAAAMAGWPRKWWFKSAEKSPSHTGTSAERRAW